MRTEQEVKEKLKELKQVYSITNDASHLQQLIFAEIRTLEWLLGNE